MHEQWADRFWAKVPLGLPPTACWEWLGAKLPSGYGCFFPVFKINGQRKGTTFYAHRVSWEIASGTMIPAGKEILHSCDNPPCVNPAHLSVGTHAENVRDMINKGRQGKSGSPGESHPQHKLTENDVRRIRSMWATGEHTQERIAVEFNVTRALIGHIVRRRAWKHVE